MNGEDVKGQGWRFVNDWPLPRFIMLNAVLVVLLNVYALVRTWFPSPLVADIGYLLIPLLILIPGAGLMRLIGMHGHDLSRSVMYSLALSILLLMFVGFGVNLLHYAGIVERPYSQIPVVTAFSLVIVAITTLAAWRDREYSTPRSWGALEPSAFPLVALAMLPPFVTVIGTSLTGFQEERTLLWLAVTILCLMPLAVLSHRFKRYDILVLSLSVSILLQRVLMSNFLMGYDVFSEYAAGRIATENGWWDMSEYRAMYGSTANTSMAIITMAPMLTQLTGVGTLELLKFVFPFIFSFLALGVFKAIQSQLGTAPAYLGVCLLVGYISYYNLLSQMAKQQMAEIFLVVLLLVFTDALLTHRKKVLLTALCLVGVIVSHYGMAYITIGFVGGLVFFNMISSLIEGWRARKDVRIWPLAMVRNWWIGQRRTQIVSVFMLVFYVAVFFIWYANTASGLELGYITYRSAYIPSASPSTGYTLAQFDALEFLLIDYGNMVHNVEKYLVVGAQILTILGLIYVWRNKEDLMGRKVSREFLYMGMLAAILLVMCYTVPKLSAMLYFSRFFHIIFIFLCGFLMFGLIALYDMVKGLRPKLKKVEPSSRTIMAICAIFVVVFMAFNTSLVYTTTEDYSNSFSLDEKVSWAIYSDSDVQGAKWVSMDQHRGERVIMADQHRFTIFIGESVPSSKLLYQWTSGNTDSLIFLSTWNMEYEYVYSINAVGAVQTYTPLSEVLDQFEGNYNVVYSTGGATSVIYVPPSDPVTNPPGPSLVQYETVPLYFLGATAVALVALAITGLIVRRIYR
ncbi:MAG: DUF2206 domain-containing protein [Methanomassiliicoccales archaeon]